MLETEEIYPGGYPPKKNRLWKKIEDKMEQVRADVFKEKPIHWFSILLWGLVFLCAFIVMKSCSDPEAVPAGGCYAAVEETMPEVGDSVPETFFDEVYDYIFKLRLDHPDIVMAQCIEESGGFTSKLFVEGHNCLDHVRSCPFQLVAGVYSRLCYMAEYICPTAHKGRIFRLFRQSLCGEERL